MYPVYYPVEGDVLPVLFHTFGARNESLTLTGLAITDVEIFKDGSVTQRASDAGYTLLDTDGIDFDGITGIHGFSIDLGDNTTAGFFEVGPWYHVVVSAVTVNAQTVNFIACAFRIVSATRGLAGTALPNAAADAAGGLPISDAGGLDLDSKLANTNEVTAARMGALTDWINGGRLDLILDDILLDTGTTLQGELDGIQADTEDIQSRLPAALTGDGNIKADTLRIGGTLQTANDVGADVDAILVDTAEIGAAGAGLTEAGGTGDHLTAINLPDQTMNITGDITGNVSGSVGSVTGAVGSVTGAVGSVTGNVGGNVAGSVGSLATQAKADVNAEVDTALSDAGVNTTRLAELDAANLPADIDQIKADLPSRPTKNVALSNFPFLMVDATDLNTPETGLTVTATISKDGGAFAACTNAVSEISNGLYKITLTSTEMNADVVILKFTATGAAQRTIVLLTQP